MVHNRCGSQTKTYQMSFQFTQVVYFDFSTTASCGGSPIIITTTGTGCNSATALNENSGKCSTYSDPAKEYTMQWSRCSNDPFSLSSYARNYVVKTYYQTSSSCGGTPLSGVAVAADSMCHANPGGTNSSIYVKVNCNGDQPVWNECTDANCRNCQQTSFTKDSCQLMGAGASEQVFCYTAAANPVTSSGTKNATLPPSPVPFGPLPNSSLTGLSKDGSFMLLWMTLIVFGFRI